MINVIQTIKEHFESLKDDYDSSLLRGSQSGKCPRQMAYAYHGYEAEPLSWRSKLVFDLGNKIENQLADILKHHGFVDQQKEVTVNIDGHKIKGHIDGRFDGEPYPWDIKSINTRGFSQAKKGITNYLHQLHFYMKGLNTDKGYILYYNKDTSALHVQEIKWMDGIWNEIVGGFRQVLGSSKNHLPDRQYGPNDKGRLPWNCTYCSYNKICWPDYELTFDKDGRPQFFVKKENN